MNWSDRREVIKGDIGEQIVEDHLASLGFIVYRPTSGPHPFDRLCASSDKRQIFIAEVKSKPHRKYYPDTGFNHTCFEDYTRISARYGMDVFMYFCDEFKGEIYGGELFSELAVERVIEYNGRLIKYPLRDKGIIYFPLESM